MQYTRKLSFALAVTVCTTGLFACTGQKSQEPGINQSEICEVNDWSLDVTTTACKPGQKIVFLPNRWGNDQLPIVFAGLNCDLRYSVAMNNGGVTCIYMPITPKKAATEQPPQKP